VHDNAGGALRIIAVSFILSMGCYLFPVQNSTAIIDIFESIDIHSTSIDNNVFTCDVNPCIGSNNDDTIIGSSSSETIYGLNGNDLLQGNRGADIIYGGSGDDSIQGGSGLDKLFGQDGNDYLSADTSTSLVDSLPENKLGIGISSSDLPLRLETSSPKIDIVDFSKNSNSSDIFANSKIDVLLIPGSFLDGGKGDDHLLGGNGDDILIGGPGRDSFECGEGIDQVEDFNPKEDTVSNNCEIIK
jgi:Ca2+-binding RTX toxin-like protein